jgi:hypothetical protein
VWTAIYFFFFCLQFGTLTDTFVTLLYFDLDCYDAISKGGM